MMVRPTCQRWGEEVMGLLLSLLVLEADAGPAAVGDPGMAFSKMATSYCLCPQSLCACVCCGLEALESRRVASRVWK